MAHAQYHYSNSSDSLEYPEQPSYPYLYARSEAGHTVRFTSLTCARSPTDFPLLCQSSQTPAVSHAPLPPPSVAPSHRSSVFVGSRGPIPTRTYSDTSRSSGDSYITPSLSASQVGNRHRANYAHSASQPRSRATSFVSRDDLRRSSVHPSQAYASSRPPPMAMSPARPPTVFTAGSSSSKPIMRRLRGVLKKTRPHGDGSSHTSSSSAPDVIEDSQTDMSSLPELNFPVPPSMIPHAHCDQRHEEADCSGCCCCGDRV
ncbi:hypothetical protein BDV93DRAFT_118107 [Ceratobasidium sp. AG-I]|nr:hypothetical protein BDV93DRAFT_118107 [Ceratobasidium sp. AG-I]